MSRNSLKAAKAELAGLMTAGGNVGDVTGVYPFEPLGGHMAKPTAITVSTVGGGMDPDFYQLALRCYHAAGADVHQAQDNLDEIILAVESRLTSGFGMSTWTVDYEADIEAFVATTIIPVGREDWPH